jgi:hypothetical protein
MWTDPNPEPQVLDYTATGIISFIKMPHELHTGTNVLVRYLRKTLCKKIYGEDSGVNLKMLHLQAEKCSCNRKQIKTDRTLLGKEGPN